LTLIRLNNFCIIVVLFFTACASNSTQGITGANKYIFVGKTKKFYNFFFFWKF